MSVQRYLDRILNRKRYLVSVLQETTNKPIIQSIVSDDVREAFKDFVKLVKYKYCAVAGGLAVCKYTEPRATMDIDIITTGAEGATEIKDEVSDKFYKVNLNVLKHKATGIKLELLTPDFIAIPEELIDDSLNTAIYDGNIKVVDVRHLIALKLNDRALDKKSFKSDMDRSDIKRLIKTYGVQDLSDLNLEQKYMDLYNQLIKELEL
jgi:hypothetical protein